MSASTTASGRTGLALRRRIVERHGGELDVDAEPGEGATVTFTPPAVDASV